MASRSNGWLDFAAVKAHVRGLRPAGVPISSADAAGAPALSEHIARETRNLQRLLETNGRIALFAHAHILRVLAGCWIADDARMGAHLVLGTASVSQLGFDRENRAILQWNAIHH